jgi:hypothetical protein
MKNMLNWSQQFIQVKGWVYHTYCTGCAVVLCILFWFCPVISAPVHLASGVCVLDPSHHLDGFRLAPGIALWGAGLKKEILLNRKNTRGILGVVILTYPDQIDISNNSNRYIIYAIDLLL